jgi:hypothetical protein
MRFFSKNLALAAYLSFFITHNTSFYLDEPTKMKSTQPSLISLVALLLR